MKVINLLNKIVMGEKVPEKIAIDGIVYKVEHNNIIDRDYYINEDNCLLETINDVYKLDKEVEIIEDKKIEKIDLSEWAEIRYQEDWEMLTKDFNRNWNLFVNKINKIIDYLEEDKDE